MLVLCHWLDDGICVPPPGEIWVGLDLGHAGSRQIANSRDFREDVGTALCPPTSLRASSNAMFSVATGIVKRACSPVAYWVCGRGRPHHIFTVCDSGFCLLNSRFSSRPVLDFIRPICTTGGR